MPGWSDYAFWQGAAEGLDLEPGQPGDSLDAPPAVDVARGQAAEAPRADSAATGDERADERLNLEILLEVPVPVTVKVGQLSMSLGELLQLGVGSVIELRKPAGQPVDLCVRDVRFGRGEVVVVDNNFGLRVTEIAEPQSRIRELGGPDREG